MHDTGKTRSLTHTLETNKNMKMVEQLSQKAAQHTAPSLMKSINLPGVPTTM